MNISAAAIGYRIILNRSSCNYYTVSGRTHHFYSSKPGGGELPPTTNLRSDEDVQGEVIQRREDDDTFACHPWTSRKGNYSPHATNNLNIAYIYLLIRPYDIQSEPLCDNS